MAMLNLWGKKNSPISGFNYHRYPGSNELITLFYGEPFLVQNTAFLVRDIGVKRHELNAFKVLRGEELKSEIYNAHLSFFREDKLGAFSKSVLSNYMKWTNERVCILIPRRFFAVIDHCVGSSKDNVEVRWNLKGEPEIIKEREIVIKLFENRLRITSPVEEKVELIFQKAPNENPIFDHQADFSLVLRTKEATQVTSFVTIFIPINDSSDMETKTCLIKPNNPLDARRARRGGYPWAVGILINRGEEKWMIISRTSFCEVAFDFNNIVTDAELMIIHSSQNEAKMIISFTRTTHILLKSKKRQSDFFIDFQGDKPDYWTLTEDSITMLWKEKGSGLLELPKWEGFFDAFLGVC